MKMRVTPLVELLTSAPRWFVASIFGMLVFLVYLLTAWYGERQNTDTWAAALSAWSLGQNRTLDLTGYSGPVPWRVDVGDTVVTNRFPGVILSATPFYWALGDTETATTYPAGVSATFWAALAVVLAYLVFCRLAGQRVALGAALVFAFATPVWSVSADSLWTHAPSQVFILLSVLLLSRNRVGSSGLAFGAAALCRPHLLIGATGMGLYVAWKDRSIAKMLVFGAASAVGAVMLIAYNRVVFREWSVTGGYAAEHLESNGVGPLVFTVNVIGSVVSPHRGVLLLTPVLFVLLPGFRTAWSASPHWVRASAVAGLAYAFTQLWLIRFTGGQGFYSYRIMIEPMTLASPLLLMAYMHWTSKTPARVAIFRFLVVLSIGFYSFGAILDQHRPESGNPFRSFSGFVVARDAGGWTTGAWLMITVVMAILVARHAARCYDPNGLGWQPGNKEQTNELAKGDHEIDMAPSAQML